jgi:isopentenyl diphosphate isomerase/L-lactate dehydrogenase-like FMN-dependent dehydrogenase
MADKFVTLPEIRKHAKKILPRDVWNFGDGGAESETTVRRNRRAVDRLAIRQDILVDVREIDLRTSLLGMPLSWPVAIAPMGGLVLFHPEGDREMARGAAQGDTLQFLSGASGWSVEDVAKASSGPKMFQLYHHGDRTWAADLLSRVEASGYLSVCLTVDVQVYGRRERDIVNRFNPRDAMGRLEVMIAMAGYDIPMRALRQQVSSAIQLVVQASRLTGGKRKVTRVSEISGMEGEQITMHDIFSFEQQGVDGNGHSVGQFVCHGIRPR